MKCFGAYSVHATYNKWVLKQNFIRNEINYLFQDIQETKNGMVLNEYSDYLKDLPDPIVSVEK